MSRLYNIEIEVANVNESQFEAITDVIVKEVTDDSNDCSFMKDEEANVGKIVCVDDTVLCGEETEEEAHYRIVEAIKKVAPNVKVTTKWHYAEWNEWDEIYTN